MLIIHFIFPGVQYSIYNFQKTPYQSGVRVLMRMNPAISNSFGEFASRVSLNNPTVIEIWEVFIRVESSHKSHFFLLDLPLFVIRMKLVKYLFCKNNF